MTKAAITSPAPGSTLPGHLGHLHLERWDRRPRVQLLGGDDRGRQQSPFAGDGARPSATVNNLPANGVPVYVRLWTQLPTTGWLFTDYTYTARQ